jgi:hypothetical protein
MPDESSSQKNDAVEKPKDIAQTDGELSPQAQSLAEIEAEDSKIYEQEAETTGSSVDFEVQRTQEHPAVAEAWKPQKKSRKGLIFASVSAILVLGLLGGGAAAYAWYQNPEKVVLDGVTNLATTSSAVSNGTMTFDNDMAKVSVTYSSKTNRDKGSSGTAEMKATMKDGPTVSVKSDAVLVTSGDAYLRVQNLQKAYDAAMDGFMKNALKDAAAKGEKVTKQQEKELRDIYDQILGPIIKSIDNQWIKFSVNDIDVDKESKDTYTCEQNVIKKATSDKDVLKQVRDVYSKNKFLNITKGSQAKGDSEQYTLSVNDPVAEKFTNAVKQLPIYKEYEACDKSEKDVDTEQEAPSQDSKTSSEMKVWINKWNHKITDFEASSKMKDPVMSILVNGSIKYDQAVSIDTPKDAKSFKDIQKEIESSMTSLFSESSMSSEDWEALEEQEI